MLFLSEVWLLWVRLAAGFREGAASIAEQTYLKCIYEMNFREYFSFISLFFQRMVLTVASCRNLCIVVWTTNRQYVWETSRHLRLLETPDTGMWAKTSVRGGYIISNYIFFRLNKDSAIKSETFQRLEENINGFNNTNYIKWEVKGCNILYNGQKPYWKSGSLSTLQQQGGWTCQQEWGQGGKRQKFSFHILFVGCHEKV